ncbi:hypothetical protein RRG08_037758 [Elysia crispata]|uniref:PH domain-containing protein n=1 Tax=Elysia crispata TaxID=231223 RepID=A0AAE1DTS1_9GAST|nr:hypothetical protein RRG08_037758 [Elysia crispata]
MVGVSPAPDFREIKVGVMLKRSQGKSAFTKENYQRRVFVLDTSALRYFDGSEKERGDEKGSILVSEMLAVEPVEDGLLTGQKHAFQIAYTYEVDQSTIALYVVAPNEGARDSWITAIRTEALKHDAQLQEYYHRGILVEGIYNCCGRKMDMDGCQKASQRSASRFCRYKGLCRIPHLYKRPKARRLEA